MTPATITADADRFSRGATLSIDGRRVTVTRSTRDSAGQIVVVGVTQELLVIATYGAPLAPLGIEPTEPHSAIWLTPSNAMWLFDALED